MAAVLFAFIFFIERPIREERSRPPNHHILPGFVPSSVTNIVLQPWEQPAIVIERAGANQPWRLRRPISYPARAELVDGFLQQLAGLEWVERISDEELKRRPDALDGYGLTKPRFSVLLEGPRSPARRLDVGEQTAYGDQVFFSVVGGTSVYLAGTNILGWMPADKTQWRSVALLDLAEAHFDALSAQAAGEEFYLQRDPTNHLWLMTKPQTARADTEKVNGLLAQLQRMRVLFFVPDDAQSDSDAFGFQAGHAPDLLLTFYSGSNVVAGLQAGAGVTNRPDLVFARRISPSNIVVVARAPLSPWEAPYTNFLDQHFISLPPSSIQSIDVQGADTFKAVRQARGQWIIQARQQFPADAQLMQDWLACFTNIQTEIKKTVVADLSEYGLAHPMLSYALECAAGGSQAAPRIEFGTNRAGQIFERRPDEYFINTISGGDFDRLPRFSWQLRDRAIWNFNPSNVVQVTVKQEGGERVYVRDPSGMWTFAPGFHGPPLLNSPELEEALFRLSHLRAVYWDGVGADPKDYFGLARTDHLLELSLRNGNATNTLRLNFGGESPYLHRYAAVERGGERLIFEFPADLYENFVRYDLSVPAAFRHHD